MILEACLHPGISSKLLPQHPEDFVGECGPPGGRGPRQHETSHHGGQHMHRPLTAFRARLCAGRESFYHPGEPVEIALDALREDLREIAPALAASTASAATGQPSAGWSRCSGDR